MNRVLPVHPPAGFRRPRNNLFVIRGGGFGQLPAMLLPAMHSPLVQSGLYPVPLPEPSATPYYGQILPAPMTSAGLSTPVLGFPVWFWLAGGGVVYWLFFSGGGRRGGGGR